MKIIVHIGFHKTGTTALQHCLSEHREDLERSGYIYPCGLSSWPSHPEIAWALTDNIYPWQDGKYNLDTVRAYYAKIIEQIDNIILLSSEEFCRLDSGGLKKLQEFFSFADVWFLAYIRSPREFLASRYRHEVQNGEGRPFIKFLENELSTANFYQRIREWESYFPNRVLVRDFRRANFIGGDICSEFLSATGHASPEQYKSSYEEQIIHPGLASILSMINRKAVNFEDQASFLEKALAMSAELGYTSPSVIFDEYYLPPSLEKSLDDLEAGYHDTLSFYSTRQLNCV